MKIRENHIHFEEIQRIFSFNLPVVLVANAYLFCFRIGLCAYSGYKIYPGHGKTMVKVDGKVNPISYGEMI